MDHIHTFLTTHGHGGPSRMSDQLNAGATSEKTRTLKTIHIIHAHIHSEKTNMKGWLWWENDIRRPCGPKASRHYFFLQVRKNPEKNHPETCPDRESNPGPLRDRCACYRLLHSGGHMLLYQTNFKNVHWLFQKVQILKESNEKWLLQQIMAPLTLFLVAILNV